MNVRDELKRCPFCAGVAKTMEQFKNTILLSKRMGYIALCRACHCCTPIHETEQEAINAWNTRAALSISERASDEGAVAGYANMTTLQHVGSTPLWREPFGDGTALYTHPPQATVRPVRENGLHYELLGVIADVEMGKGFDDVCLRTIKRVAEKLAAQEPSP